MSMIIEYVRLRPHELTELRRLLVEEPDNAYEYASDLRIGGEDDGTSSRGMDTDKAWARPAVPAGQAGPAYRCHWRRRTRDR